MVNDVRGVGHPPLQPAPARPALGEAANHATRPPQSGAGADTVTLTGSAQLLNRLESRVDQAAHLDLDRVTAIKKEIASGAYSVDATKVAAQFARMEADMAGGDGSRVKGSVDFQQNESGFTVTVNQTSAGGRERMLEATYNFDAANRTVSRDVTRTGANGQTVETHAEVTRNENGFSNERTLTTPGGNTISRTVEQAYDAESGVLSRVVSHTNGAGETVQRSIAATQGESGIEVKSSLDVIVDQEV